MRGPVLGSPAAGQNATCHCCPPRTAHLQLKIFKTRAAAGGHLGTQSYWPPREAPASGTMVQSLVRLLHSMSPSTPLGPAVSCFLPPEEFMAKIDSHCQATDPAGWLLFKNFFKDFYLFIFLERRREGEREGEKHQCVVASHTLPIGDLTCNPDMCPKWESNQ